MPRIHPPSQAATLQKPREFALLQQLTPTKEGDVQDKALNELAKRYGSGKDQLPAEMSFEEFAGLFAKPSSKAESGEGNCIGWAAFDPTGHLKPWRFTRRETQPTDVRIQIAYAGICHSDIHTVRNEWKNAQYPIVPGHEIVGFVTEVGSQVTKFKVGDRVGVGCMVNSCQKCRACVDMKEEQYCESGNIGTYNSKDVDGTMTMGGYSTHVLVNEKFVIRVPESLDLSHTAPLLCAGITVYSPIKHFGFDKPGLKIGVVGLGGLGHMAVKFLSAFGVETTVISRSPSKKDEAINVLGATHFLVSTDENQMKAAAGSLDGIIDTVSAQHDLGQLLSLMRVDGTLVCVGAPEVPPPMPTFAMLFRRQRVAGSLIGGIKETQEMIDFCGEKGIVCMSEIIPIDKCNEAYERVVKADVRYRFVIDIQGTLVN